MYSLPVQVLHYSQVYNPRSTHLFESSKPFLSYLSYGSYSPYRLRADTTNILHWCWHAILRRRYARLSAVDSQQVAFHADEMDEVIPHSVFYPIDVADLGVTNKFLP